MEASTASEAAVSSSARRANVAAARAHAERHRRRRSHGNGRRGTWRVHRDGHLTALVYDYELTVFDF
jgi:hypothetical protein